MGAVLGDVLPFAVTVAISPVPIIAVILMLLAPRARGTSVGFMIGWVGGVVVATAVFVVLAGAAGLGSSSSGEPSAVVSWVKLVLGVLMLIIAGRQWHGRPEPGEAPELPGWLTAIDKVTPGRAVGLGALLSALNPKNLMMCVAAGVAIGAGGTPIGAQIIAFVVFVVIAVCSVVVPVAAYLTATDRMRGPLQRLKAWLEANNATVMFVLVLVIGVVLLGKGLSGLIR